MLGLSWLVPASGRLELIVDRQPYVGTDRNGQIAATPANIETRPPRRLALSPTSAKRSGLCRIGETEHHRRADGDVFPH
jgi:hypothetical protein